MTTSSKRIFLLPLPEGDVVARLTNPEGEFHQFSTGEIHFTYRHGDERRWYVKSFLRHSCR